MVFAKYGLCQVWSLPNEHQKLEYTTRPTDMKLFSVFALCLGLQDRVEFSPREGRKVIAPEAELELCDGRCNLTRIAVTAKLTTAHIGKGCDRDTYSLQSQRKLCGKNLWFLCIHPCAYLFCMLSMTCFFLLFYLTNFSTKIGTDK